MGGDELVGMQDDHTSVVMSQHVIMGKWPSTNIETSKKKMKL